MKNWVLPLGGLALAGVVLVVLLGGDPADQPDADSSDKTITAMEPGSTPPAAAGTPTEASMDRSELEADSGTGTGAGPDLEEGFVTALPFTGPAATLKLRLLDGADRPAAGAYVRVDLEWDTEVDALGQGVVLDGEAWQEGNRIAPDDGGRIEIELPAGATLGLALTGPTSREQHRALQPLRAGEIVDLGDVHLSPASLLAGFVRGPEGEAVADAAINLKPAGSTYWGGGHHASTVSKDDGSYELPSLPAGSYQLDVSAAGFGKLVLDQLEMKTGEVQSRDLEMVRGRSVRGRVLAPDGSPVAEAKVFLTPLQEEMMFWGDWRPPVPDGDAHALTAADGSFEVHGMPEDGMAMIGARAEGLAPAQVEAGPESGEVTLRLDRAYEIAGRIVDDAGEGVAGIDLGLIQIRGADQEESTGWTTSVEDGYFAFTMQAAGSYRIEAYQVPPGFEPLVLTLDRDREDLELKLPQAPRLRVRVVDAEGQPVPRAMVYLEAPGSGEPAGSLELLELGYVEMVSDVHLSGFSGFSGMPGYQQETDEDGWALFPALASGDFELIVQGSGYTNHTEPLSLGLGDEEVEVVLSRGATLRLTLTDESGEPVGDLPVTLKNAASGKELQSIHTDALGRAVWSDLEAGLYQIAYRANEADGYWWGRNDDEEVAHDQPVVDLEAGEIKEETLVVRDLALVTVIVRRGGLAAADIGVRLQEIQDNEMHWYGSNEPGKPTDGRGKVVLDPVQAGRYKVIVKGSLDTPPLEQEVELHGGPQSIDIDLNGARIEGKLRGSDNAPLVGARVALVPYVEEIAEDGSTRPRQPNMVMNWSSRGLEFTDYAEMMTSTKTDGYGGFAFRDVPEGRWQVVARAEGHGPWHSQPHQVLGSTTVDVGDHRLAAMAVIEGRDMNWTPNPQAQPNGYFDWNNSVRLERADDGMNFSMAQIDETGHYRLVDLAAGTYRLRKGQYHSDPFTLREGEMMRHDIPLEEPDDDE